MKLKVKSYPKLNLEVGGVYFSSDLHINHEKILQFGRKFSSVEEMNETVTSNINERVSKDDALVLLGDTLMGEKNYEKFLSKLKCNNILLLAGNHCNYTKLFEATSNKVKYVSHLLEVEIDGKFVNCSHYPLWNWNYQDVGSYSLHGHLHSDEDTILQEIHKYKSLDVGIDNYYKIYGHYYPFSWEEVKGLLRDKLIKGRHNQ